jgi:hypothetical protein
MSRFKIVMSPKACMSSLWKSKGGCKRIVDYNGCYLSRKYFAC